MGLRGPLSAYQPEEVAPRNLTDLYAGNEDRAGLLVSPIRGLGGRGCKTIPQETKRVANVRLPAEAETDRALQATSILHTPFQSPSHLGLQDTDK